MKKCIYEIQIGHYYYIGKQVRNQRHKEHLNLLVNNKHYNIFMQNAYNKYKELKFRIIFESKEISMEELSELEISTIKQYREEKGFSSVMNLTNGGDGGKGHIKTPAQIEQARKFMTERNPTRKISREEVLMIYEDIKQGKTNSEIGERYNLHSGYISQIRIGNKYKDLFSEHFTEPVGSSGRQKISYETFLEIINLKNNGLNYQEISSRLNIDRSSINRICLEKTYKSYWKRYKECV